MSRVHPVRQKHDVQHTQQLLHHLAARQSAVGLADAGRFHLNRAGDRRAAYKMSCWLFQTFFSLLSVGVSSHKRFNGVVQFVKCFLLIVGFSVTKYTRFVSTDLKCLFGALCEKKKSQQFQPLLVLFCSARSTD